MINNPVNPMVRGGRGGGSPGTRAVYGRKHGGVNISLQSQRSSHARAVGYCLKELWKVGSPCWSKLILKDCSICKGPVWVNGKSEEGVAVCTDHSLPFPTSSAPPSRVVEAMGEGRGKVFT